MRNCADINTLINQEIVHWDDIDHLAWDKEDTYDISIWFMHDLLWKNDIVKQVKNWEIIIMMWVNVVLIHVIDAVIETCETVCS